MKREPAHATPRSCTQNRLLNRLVLAALWGLAVGASAAALTDLIP